MFEKIIFSNSTEKAEKEENKLLKIIKDSTKITAILMAFSLPAQEVTGQNSGNKENIEYSIEMNKEIIKNIRTKLLEIKKDVQHTLGGVNVLEHQIDGNTILMPKDNDRYTVVMSNDGKISFIDKDSDGKVDGVVLNGEGGESDRTILHNFRYLNTGVEGLIEEADIIKGTELEKDVRVIRFDQKKELTHFADLKEAKGGTISWDDSVKLFEDGQSLYSKKIQEISKGLEK